MIFHSRHGLQPCPPPPPPTLGTGCMFSCTLCQLHIFSHLLLFACFSIATPDFSRLHSSCRCLGEGNWGQKERTYIFTIIGYITNSQLTIYPCGLIAQWIGIAPVLQGHGFESCSSLNFFRLLFQLLQLKAHCKDHNFTHVYLQFTYT